MASLLILLLFFLPSSATAMQRGEFPEPGSLLAQVSIKLPDDDTASGSGACSGTRIGPRHVLTAAHCARASGVVVFWNGAVARIAKRHVHEWWNNDTDAYDFAVLELSGAVPDGPAASLARFEELPRAGTVLEISGFGYTETGRDDGRLRMAFAIASSERPSPSELLTKGRKGSGICSGDSGGGAFVREGSRLRVVGVSSSTYETGRFGCSSSVILAPVAVARKWIMLRAGIPEP